MKKSLNKWGFLSLMLGMIFAGSVHATLIDRIIAVVEDDVILDSELSYEATSIARNLQANNVMMPPEYVLRKQVLERMIIDMLQRQLAKRSGISISDEMLRSQVVDIARRNNMTLAEFQTELEGQGMNFKSFEDNIRNEIIINQLRAREIGTRIKVTDREVSHFLETQGEKTEEKVQYHLGHILVAIPEGASASTIQEARLKTDQVISDLRQGEDFKQTAIAVSDGGNALKGGDLGWRGIGQIPTLFVDSVNKMNAGDIADAIRSPSGFHIIKMLEMKGVAKHMVTKTNARHILIKTNEIVNDEEAQKRLLTLKDRIADGDSFATLARSNSDDKGSAINGGELGWVGPGDLVPAFEKTMNALALNETSDPVQTEFGWHIIQVLSRETKDNSVEFKKQRVIEEIRKRKIEEETELWLRRLRDEAYVEIMLERL